MNFWKLAATKDRMEVKKKMMMTKMMKVITPIFQDLLTSQPAENCQIQECNQVKLSF